MGVFENDRDRGKLGRFEIGLNAGRHMHRLMLGKLCAVCSCHLAPRRVFHSFSPFVTRTTAAFPLSSFPVALLLASAAGGSSRSLDLPFWPGVINAQAIFVVSFEGLLHGALVDRCGRGKAKRNLK